MSLRYVFYSAQMKAIITLIILVTLIPFCMGDVKESEKSVPEATLKSIRMVRLCDPVDALEKEYEKPVKKEKSEEYEDVTVYTFEPKESIRIVASVWKGVVHSAVYWCLDENSDPDSELLHVGMTYSEGKPWTELSSGHLYQTKDDKFRLWCSAVPAIGVGTVEFLSGRISISKKAGQEATSQGDKPSN